MQRWIAPALAALFPAIAAADTVVTTTTVVITDSDTASPACARPADTPGMPQPGATLGIGVVSRALPASVRSATTGPVLPTAYTIDDTAAKSLWLTVGIEKKNFVFMTDMTFGGASISGMTRALADPPFMAANGSSFSYTGTLLESSLAFRLGARVALGDIALEAGSGIGGTLWVIASSHVDRGSASVFDAPMGPDGPAASWFIPVWAAATYKPSAAWGVELLASSDRAPGTGTATTTLGLGLVYQPATP